MLLDSLTHGSWHDMASPTLSAGEPIVWKMASAAQQQGPGPMRLLDSLLADDPASHHLPECNFALY